jgi:hypothetical protein
LLTRSYGEIRDVAESIRKRLGKDNAEQAGNLLEKFSRQAIGSPNPFASALALYILAYLVHNFEMGRAESEESKEGQAVRGVDWIRSYIESMLNANGLISTVDKKDTSAGSPLTLTDQEIFRRQAYVIALQLATWAAASPQHVNDLAAKASSSDEVVKGWLFRALVLGDRVLFLLLTEFDAEPAAIVSRLRGALDTLGLAINSDFYPDVFNPFLFGPGACDPALMSLLHVLLLSWEDMCRTGDPLPFWWSDQIEQELVKLSDRAANEAEKRVRLDREQKKPNRLGVALDRTPQELALALLARARTNQT